MDILQLTKKQLQEESLIDIAYALLTEKEQSMTVVDLLEEIRKVTGFTKAEMQEKIAQFYTDMNVDGRFLALDEGQWGLREWYPIDQIKEETAPVVKVHEDDEDFGLDELDELDEELEDTTLLEDDETEDDIVEGEDEDDFDDYDEDDFDLPDEEFEDVE